LIELGHGTLPDPVPIAECPNIERVVSVPSRIGEITGTIAGDVL